MSDVLKFSVSTNRDPLVVLTNTNFHEPKNNVAISEATLDVEHVIINFLKVNSDIIGLDASLNRCKIWVIVGDTVVDYVSPHFHDVLISVSFSIMRKRRLVADYLSAFIKWNISTETTEVLQMNGPDQLLLKA